MRVCYRCLLWLHPPGFRREFSGEMLWIYDESARAQGTARLFFDGLGSLARQWLLRSGWWKIALALSLAVLQIILGGFAAILFGHRHLEAPARDPSVVNIAELAQHGAIAHQPLTVGIVMYLAVFITGGLAMMVVGLTFWTRHFSRRVR
ncbi:MAG TPA: hypothetical protein VMB03_17890 [Bryobacteraceae bacterium]|nr:hypothetical protein [Bryobacteraceae bacterium]